VFPHHFINYRQPKIADGETENNRVTETITSRIEIPTAYLEFTTTQSSKTVSVSDCDNHGQPEVAKLTPKQL